MAWKIFKNIKIKSKAHELAHSTAELEIILTLGSPTYQPQGHCREENVKTFGGDPIYSLGKRGFIKYSSKMQDGMKPIYITVPEVTTAYYASLTELGQEVYKYVHGWVSTDIARAIEK